MHIEISAGGLRGAVAAASFQSGMKNYISKTDGMISSFKAVRIATYNLNGGVDRLANAVSQVSARERGEESRKAAAETVQAKVNDFLNLAIRVDQSVNAMVKRNREELYGKYPSLKPSPGQWFKDGVSHAWNWLCNAGKGVANAAEKAWISVKDTAQKAWNSIVTFYEEHKELIGKIVSTVLIVAGAVAAIAAVIATGGLALAPLIGTGLAALGVSATTAAAIATVISAVVGITAVVSTIGASTMNVVDTWVDKSDDATFQTWKKVFNVVSIVTNTLYSIGNLYNAYKGVSGKEYISQHRVSNTPESLPAGTSSSSTPVTDNAPSEVSNAKAQRIAAKHPETTKSIPTDEIGTTKKDWQITELRVEQQLGDEYTPQVILDKDLNVVEVNSNRIPSKGNIKIDNLAAYDKSGNKIVLQKGQNLKEAGHFDAVEAKNFSIEKAANRSALKRNILDQAGNRNQFLSRYGADVHQTYIQELVGHKDIPVLRLDALYKRLIKELPSNVDVDFGSLLK